MCLKKQKSLSCFRVSPPDLQTLTIHIKLHKIFSYNDILKIGSITIFPFTYAVLGPEHW